MIKLDKNGKFLFNKKVLDSSLYYHPKYNGIDIFMVSTYEKVVIVDKMGNIVSSFKTKLLKNITYEQGNVYYLTQDQELVIADIKGKIKSSFNLKKLDDSILSLEVINDKIMVVEQNQVSIYNLNGELHKVFDYNDLTVSEDKYNGERQKPVLYSSVKFNNNIYMNWFLASYSMVDCYDQNMELVNRKLYKNSFEDVAAFNYNTTIMMGEEVSNYKYSNEYKMFIKTVYDK